MMRLSITLWLLCMWIPFSSFAIDIIDPLLSKCIVTPTKHEPTFSEVIEHIHETSMHTSKLNETIKLLSKEVTTPDTIQLGCDLYFGPIDEYQMDSSSQKLSYERYLLHFLNCLEPGVVIMVSANWVERFFREIYYKINVPFVLVTGGYSDTTVPGGVAMKNEFLDKQNSKILHWYSTNCGDNPDPERFSCIPLGLSSLVDHSSAEVMMEKFALNTVFTKDFPSHIKLPRNATYDIVVSFSVTSNARLRMGIWMLFCGGTPQEVTTTIYDSPFLYTNSKNITALCFNRIKLEDSLYVIAQNSFVISPHGGGRDCFRTWETLLLGSYPIVYRGSLDEMYNNLPVLILEDWNDLSLDLLAKARIKFESSKYTYDALYRSYYIHGLFRQFGYQQHSYERTGLEEYVSQVMKRLNVEENDLIRGEQKDVYVIKNHQRCPISIEVFRRLNYDFTYVKRMSDVSLNEIPPGPEVL